MGLFLISFSLSLKSESGNWRALANCLQMGVPQQANVSSNDVLRFIHRRHYMIVPQSNPPQQIPPMLKAPSRTTRNVASRTKPNTLKCPFEIDVIDYKDKTVPRYLSAAKCEGCNVHCKPVMYTHKLLFKKCKNHWMWTQKTLSVAFVWVLDN